MSGRPHGNGCQCRTCVPDPLTTLRAENERLREMLDRMRPVVEAAEAWCDGITDSDRRLSDLAQYVAAYRSSTARAALKGG